MTERFRRPPGSKPIKDMTPEERTAYNRAATIRFRRKIGIPERKLHKNATLDEVREYQRQAQDRHRAKRRKILAAAKQPVECPACGHTHRISF